MSTVIVLFVVMMALLILSVPVAYSIALSSIVALLSKDMNLILAAQKMLNGCDSYLFVAIPMFTFAGYLMGEGGLSKRLVKWAETCFFWVPGSTGAVTVVSCMVFAALSGSGPATIAAIGTIMLPALRKANYEDGYAGALTVAGGGLGPIIPPSIVLVVYGATMSVSIAKLFIGCTIPGLLLGVVYLIMNAMYCKKRGIGQGKTRYSLKDILRETKNSSGVLLLILIIIVGIYGGIFTPTEASAVAVVYSIILAIVYKSLSFKSFGEAVKKTAFASAGIMFIVGGSGIFSYVLSATKATAIIAEAIMPFLVNKTVYMLLLMLLLAIVGCVMDIAPAILIFAPVLSPIGVAMGVDPLHLGCVFVMNLVVGMMTPPFGMDLFTAATVLKIPYAEIVKKCIPFIVVSFAMIILFALVPGFTTWLPNLLLG